MPIAVSGLVTGVAIKQAVPASSDRPAQEKRCEIDVYSGAKSLETVQAPIEGLVQLQALVGKEASFDVTLSVWHMNGKTGKTWKLITDEK